MTKNKLVNLFAVTYKIKSLHTTTKWFWDLINGKIELKK